MLHPIYRNNFVGRPESKGNKNAVHVELSGFKHKASPVYPEAQVLEAVYGSKDARHFEALSLGFVCRRPGRDMAEPRR